MRFAPPLQGSNARCKVRTLRVGPRARARVGPRSFDFRDSIFNFRSSCQFVTVIAAGGGSGSTSASADFPKDSHPQGSHVQVPSHSRRSPPPAHAPSPPQVPSPSRRTPDADNFFPNFSRFFSSIFPVFGPRDHFRSLVTQAVTCYPKVRTGVCLLSEGTYTW